MEYTIIHTDCYETETLIRFELLPVQNGHHEIVINEVALVYDGEIIGDSPTISEAQAKDIVLASNSAEWQPFQLAPTPKYPSADRCAKIKAAFEASGARVIELQSLVARCIDYDAEYKAHSEKHRAIAAAWRRVEALWREYYECGFYPADNNIESLNIKF